MVIVPGVVPTAGAKGDPEICVNFPESGVTANTVRVPELLFVRVINLPFGLMLAPEAVAPVVVTGEPSTAVSRPAVLSNEKAAIPPAAKAGDVAPKYPTYTLVPSLLKKGREGDLPVC